MGRADDDSVVDPLTMSVHGVEGVRVVDASAMRYVTNGNIYAPVMMMAEKAADLILGNTPLAPEPVDFYRASNRLATPRTRIGPPSSDATGSCSAEPGGDDVGVGVDPCLGGGVGGLAVAVDHGRDLVLLIGGQLELLEEVERRLVLRLEPGVGRLVQRVGRIVAGVLAIGGRGRRQCRRR